MLLYMRQTRDAINRNSYRAKHNKTWLADQGKGNYESAYSNHAAVVKKKSSWRTQLTFQNEIPNILSLRIVFDMVLIKSIKFLQRIPAKIKRPRDIQYFKCNFISKDL